MLALLEFYWLAPSPTPRRFLRLCFVYFGMSLRSYRIISLSGLSFSGVESFQCCTVRDIADRFDDLTLYIVQSSFYISNTDTCRSNDSLILKNVHVAGHISILFSYKFRLN